MKLSKQEIIDLDPCCDGLKFAEACDFDIVKIWNTCERGDWLIWLLRRTENLDKPEGVKIAIACAEHVLHIFEKKYSLNDRPRKAIQAAIYWVKNPTEENRQKASASAYAASAYAAAAYAADADAAAAAAAYAAAYAAAAAGSFAAAAAGSFAAAAYAAAAAGSFADADAAAAAAAAYAADAAAAAYAYAASDAAAYTAAYAAAAKKCELKWQAEKIREIKSCPFL